MSVTAEYLRQKQQRENANRLEWANQLQIDPDRASRIFAVSAALQLPEELVDSDLDNLEARARAQDFDRDQYTDQINGAPAFNRFAAAHPYHLAVVESDHRNLSRLERAFRQTGLNYDKGWAITEIAEIRDRQLKNFEDPNREEDRAELERLHSLLEGGYFGAEGGMKFLAGGAEQAAIYKWLIGESLDEVAIGAAAGFAIGAGYGAAGGLPGAVVGGVGGIVTGGLRGGAVGVGVGVFKLERALAFDDYIGMGLDEEQARWASTAVGGANMGLELLGLRALTKYIPGASRILGEKVGGVINSVLNKPTMKQAIARVTLKYGEGVGTEIFTEVVQDATLHVGREYLKSQARAAGDTRAEVMEPGDFWSQVGEIAEHTLYGVAIIGGIGPGASFISDTSKIRTANRQLAALEAIGDAAEKSETRKKSPSVYEKFVRSFAKDGKTFVDARVFFEYFQEQSMDPEEVAQSIGVTNLGEAVTNGHDIEVDAAEWITKVGHTPHHKALTRDLKTERGVLSKNEAFTIQTAMVKEINELQALQAKENPEQAREDAEIHAKLKERLIEGGVSPEAAEFQAMVLVGIPNLARRAGATDLEAFQEERFGGIIFTTNRQLRLDKEDVDLHIDPYLNKIRAGDYPTQRSIFGPDLIEIIKQYGGLAEDSELDARDLTLQVASLFRGKKGRTLDDVAEFLHEQGYIAARDPALVLEALDKAAEGEMIYGDQFTIVESQRELADSLEALAEMLDKQGIDITDMTNKEVRDAIDAIETFYQTDDKIDTTKVDMLTKVALDAAEHDPMMLTRAMAALPRISPEQDFGDVQFTKDYTLAETDEAFVGKQDANKAFELATKRKDSLKMLKDCLRRG